MGNRGTDPPILTEQGQLTGCFMYLNAVSPGLVWKVKEIML